MTRYGRLVASFLLAVSWGAAQTTAGLEGIVRDPSEKVVPAAKVTIIELDTSAQMTATSDGMGNYRFGDLRLGAYRVVVSAPGFREASEAGVQLSAGQTARLNFRLELGEANARVEVTSQAPLLSSSAAEWSGGIERENLRSMPLNGRDLFELAAVQRASVAVNINRAGFVGGFGTALSLNGGRPNQNSFQIDGIRVNDATGLPPVSAAGKFLGVESMQELSVVSSPFSAEYGRVAAAVITAVSRSGGNEWHGDAYGYLRDSRLDARNFFDAPDKPKPPLHKGQFGGTLGGPIRRDKLFFFLNAEGIRQSQSLTHTAAVPTVDARNGLVPAAGGVQQIGVAPSIAPYLELYPQPNGRTYGDGTAAYTTIIPSHSNEVFASGKLDAYLSSRWRASFRGTGSGADSGTRDTYDFYEFRNQTRYRFANTEVHYMASPAWVHSWRTGVSRNWNYAVPNVNPRVPASLSFVPGQPMGVLQVVGLQPTGGNRAVISRLLLATTEVQAGYQVSHINGRHSLKMGAGTVGTQTNPSLDVNRRGYYYFTSLAAFLKATPAAANLTTPQSLPARTVTQKVGHAFLQYEMRVLRSLALSAGLRYEPYSAPVERHGGLATMSFPGTASAVETGGGMYHNPSFWNLAPRAGLAWNPTGGSATVVRLGFGLFHDVLGSTIYAGNRAFSPEQYRNVTLVQPSFPDLLGSLAALRSPAALSMVDRDVHQPYTLQYQAKIEHQMGQNLVVQLGYAGTRGVHLAGLLGNINTPVPQVRPDGQLYFAPGSTAMNPAFGPIGMLRTQFNSFHHSLTAQVERRSSHGLQWNARFTWGKTTDETSSVLFQDFVNADRIPTVFNYRANRGRADFDVARSLALNFAYPVPAVNWKRLRGALRDIEIHGLLQVQSGRPFGPSVGFDRAGLRALDDLGQRPDLAAPPGAKVILGRPERYFDPLAFSLPAAGTLGNLGRNVLTGPGLFSVDAAVQKRMALADRCTLSLRFEGFNLTNRPNLQLPATVALFSSSGARLGTTAQITSTATPSRQMQIAVRLTF